VGKKLITAPSVEPVSLADAKVQLSISDTVQDDVITRHIKTAREYAEKYTSCAFITQTWELALDVFPSEIEFPNLPIQSITSIKYLDTAGVEQTLDAADYGLDNYSARHWAMPAYGLDWPDTIESPNAVKVRYVAGFGDASTDVPSDIIDAILMTVTQLLKNSTTELGAPILSVAPAVNQLLNPYRILRL
jgi:uncharacterized phiE125 gp8 family phage protein